MPDAIPAPLPVQAGLRLDPACIDAISECSAAWWEVVADDVMAGIGVDGAAMDGARPPLILDAPHLSIGGADGPDPLYLERLAEMVARLKPRLVVTPLAFCRQDGAFLGVPLPVPPGVLELARVARAAAKVRRFLGVPLALSNPPGFLAYRRPVVDEARFLSLAARLGGAGIVLDLAHLAIGAANLGHDEGGYLARIDPGLVRAYRLGGVGGRTIGAGQILEPDDGAMVAPHLWALYARAVTVLGRRPTALRGGGDDPEPIQAQVEKVEAVLTMEGKSRALSIAAVRSVS